MESVSSKWRESSQFYSHVVLWLWVKEWESYVSKFCSRVEGAIIEKNENNHTGPRVRKRRFCLHHISLCYPRSSDFIFEARCLSKMKGPPLSPLFNSLCFLPLSWVLKSPFVFAFSCISDRVTSLFKALPSMASCCYGVVIWAGWPRSAWLASSLPFSSGSCSGQGPSHLEPALLLFLPLTAFSLLLPPDSATYPVWVLMLLSLENVLSPLHHPSLPPTDFIWVWSPTLFLCHPYHPCN